MYNFFLKSFSNALTKCADFIFPLKCLLCQEYVLDIGLCGSCFKCISFVNKPFCFKCGKIISLDLGEYIVCIKCSYRKYSFDKMRFLFTFSDHSKKIIHNLKYMDKTVISKFISKLMHLKYMSEIAEYDLIIPVPMHKLKKLIRMYNQTELISNELSLLSCKNSINNLLIKSRWTKPQVALKGNARKKNPINSFSVDKINASKFLQNKKVILIDDVVTTGSTIENCSKVLKQAGVSEILVLAIAYTW